LGLTRSAYRPPDNPTFGALKVSPHDAHRHAVSFVICFASVPTFVEPHAGQVGRVGSSVDMQPPVSGTTFVRPLSTGAGTPKKLSRL
jgi:hypothetical protein